MSYDEQSVANAFDIDMLHKQTVLINVIK